MNGLIVTSLAAGGGTTAYALLLGDGDNLAFKESLGFPFSPVLGVGISKMAPSLSDSHSSNFRALLLLLNIYDSNLNVCSH